MRRGLVLLGLVLALAGPVQGQTSYGCCGFKDWATYGSDNLLRYHPTAHGLGGIAMDLVARTPLWSEKIRRGPVWKRLAIVGVLGAAWQFNNLKEIPGYRWDYVGFDLGTNLITAGLTELIFPVRRTKRGE